MAGSHLCTRCEDRIVCVEEGGLRATVGCLQSARSVDLLATFTILHCFRASFRQSVHSGIPRQRVYPHTFSAENRTARTTTAICASTSIPHAVNSGYHRSIHP